MVLRMFKKDKKEGFWVVFRGLRGVPLKGPKKA